MFLKPTTLSCHITLCKEWDPRVRAKMTAPKVGPMDDER